MSDQQRPPLPPFSLDDAVAKVRKAEDAWNGKSHGLILLVRLRHYGIGAFYTGDLMKQLKA